MRAREGEAKVCVCVGRCTGVCRVGGTLGFLKEKLP